VGVKLLEQFRAACQVRRLARRTIQTDGRWVEEFLRFHHDRTGHWIHPREMGENGDFAGAIHSRRFVPLQPAELPKERGRYEPGEFGSGLRPEWRTYATCCRMTGKMIRWVAGGLPEEFLGGI